MILWRFFALAVQLKQSHPHQNRSFPPSFPILLAYTVNKVDELRSLINWSISTARALIWLCLRTLIRARQRWALLFLIISCFRCFLIPGDLQSALPLCDRESWLLPPPPPPPPPPCSGLMMRCHAGAPWHCRRLLLLIDPKFKMQSTQLRFSKSSVVTVLMWWSAHCKTIAHFYCGLQDSSSGSCSIVSLTMLRCIVRHIIENGYLETLLWHSQLNQPTTGLSPSISLFKKLREIIPLWSLLHPVCFPWDLK